MVYVRAFRVIADFRLPIANLSDHRFDLTNRQSAIGNRQ